MRSIVSNGILTNGTYQLRQQYAHNLDYARDDRARDRILLKRDFNIFKTRQSNTLCYTSDNTLLCDENTIRTTHNINNVSRRVDIDVCCDDNMNTHAQKS